MYEHNLPQRRYNQTIKFLKSVISPPAYVLDLGVENPLSEIMKDQGYKVDNTSGEDLDIHPEVVVSQAYDLITGFEILEHLVAPFNVLKEICAKKLVVIVSLNIWFAKAYRNRDDPWDWHFHEFEDWQFNWLLEKSGWQIRKTEKCTSPVKKIGIRPFLRLFTPRYYAIHATKDNQAGKWI